MEREERIREEIEDAERGEGNGGKGEERRDKASWNREERMRELRRERKVEGGRDEGEERRWERRGSGTGRFRGRKEMEGKGRELVVVVGLGLERAAVRRRLERGDEEVEVEKRRRLH